MNASPSHAEGGAEVALRNDIKKAYEKEEEKELQIDTGSIKGSSRPVIKGGTSVVRSRSGVKDVSDA